MQTRRKHTYGMPALAALAAILLAFGAGDAADTVVRSDVAVQATQDTTRMEMANEVQVTLSDFKVEAGKKAIPAGKTTFKIRNTGKVAHSLEIEGENLEKKLEAKVAPGGETTLSVELQPGTYAVYCPLMDHRERGMSLELTVTPRPEPTTGGPSR